MICFSLRYLVTISENSFSVLKLENITLSKKNIENNREVELTGHIFQSHYSVLQVDNKNLVGKLHTEENQKS